MRGVKLSLFALMFLLVAPVVVKAYSGITTIPYRALYLFLLPLVCAEFLRSLLTKTAGKAFFYESQYSSPDSLPDGICDIGRIKKGSSLG
jgi:hypothetical protein